MTISSQRGKNFVPPTEDCMDNATRRSSILRFLNRHKWKSERFHHHHHHHYRVKPLGRAKANSLTDGHSAKSFSSTNCCLELYIFCHTVRENWGGLLWTPYCVCRIHRMVTGTNHATSWVGCTGRLALCNFSMFKGAISGGGTLCLIPTQVCGITITSLEDSMATHDFLFPMSRK